MLRTLTLNSFLFQMILADDNFATIISAVREGRAVWDNLRKVLFVNIPINNAQGMTVLFGILFGLTQSPLSSIQVLYCNLICAVTLCFVTAIEPAEEGIMDHPPRRVGKRLVGRYLLLRIFLGTLVLVSGSVGSVFWAYSLGHDLYGARSQALNTLSFGAVALTASARFERKSAFHSRSFHGNSLAWWAYAIMTVCQVFITYTPGLNTIVFSQSGLDGMQWVIVIIVMVGVFIVMEAEKALRNYLADLKYDTEDRGVQPFDVEVEPDRTPLPASASRFGRNELPK